MALQTLLKFRNIDSTKDLNNRFSTMFAHGFVADSGDFSSISVTSPDITVSIYPFSAMSKDGIVLINDEQTTVTDSFTPIQGYYLTYFDVRYLEGLNTEVEFKINKYSTELSAVNASGDTWIKHAVFYVNAGGGVSGLDTAFDKGDRIDDFGRSQFKGDVSAADIASIDNKFYRSGDMVVASDTKEIYILEKNSSSPSGVNDWFKLGVADIEACLGLHRNNGTAPPKSLSTTASGSQFYNEKHLTELQYAGMSAGVALPTEESLGISGGNPVVGGKYPLTKLNYVSRTITAPPSGHTKTSDINIPVSVGHVFTGLGTATSTNAVFKVYAMPAGSSYAPLEQLVSDAGVPITVGCKYNGAYYAPSTKPLGYDDYGFIDASVPASFYLTVQFTPTNTYTHYRNIELRVYYGEKNTLGDYDLTTTQAYESLNKDFELLDVVAGTSHTIIDTDKFNYIPNSGILDVQAFAESVDQTLTATNAAVSGYIATVSAIATTLPDIRDMPTTGFQPYVGWRAEQNNSSLASAPNRFFSARIAYVAGDVDHLEIKDKGQVLSRHQRYGSSNWYTDSLGTPSGAAFVVNDEKLYDGTYLPATPSYNQGYTYRTLLRNPRISYSEWSSRHNIESGPGSSYPVFPFPFYYDSVITSAENAFFVPSSGGYNFVFSDVGNYIYVDEVNSTTTTACGRFYKAMFNTDGSANPTLELYTLEGNTHTFFSGHSGHSIKFRVFSPNLQGSLYEDTTYYNGSVISDHYYNFKQLLNLDNLSCSAPTSDDDDGRFGAAHLYVSPTWRPAEDGITGDADYPQHERYSFLTKSYNVEEQLDATTITDFYKSHEITSFLRADGCFNVEASVSGVNSLAGGCYLYGDLYDSGRFDIGIPAAAMGIRYAYNSLAGDERLLGAPVVDPIGGTPGDMGLRVGRTTDFLIMDTSSGFGAISYTTASHDSIMYVTRIPLNELINPAIKNRAQVNQIVVEYIVEGGDNLTPSKFLTVACVGNYFNGTTPPVSTLTNFTITDPGVHPSVIQQQTNNVTWDILGSSLLCMYFDYSLTTNIGPIKVLGFRLKGTIYEPRQLG